MIFVDDLVPGLPWLTPAPIGTVEDGWAGIVSDLLLEIGHVVDARPGVTVDVLAAAERDGGLLFDAVIDGADGDDGILDTVARATAVAQARAAATCSRCGRPGRLRHDRPGWPATHCDAHAGNARR